MILKVVRLCNDDPRLAALLRAVNLNYNSKRYTWFGVEHEGLLCGAGAVEIRGECAYLYNGGVLEHYRGNGIHGMIIKARTDYAKEKGCTRAEVTVFIHNKPCRSSVTKAGFKLTSNPVVWYKEL